MHYLLHLLLGAAAGAAVGHGQRQRDARRREGEVSVLLHLAIEIEAERIARGGEGLGRGGRRGGGLALGGGHGRLRAGRGRSGRFGRGGRRLRVRPRRAVAPCNGQERDGGGEQSSVHSLAIPPARGGVQRGLLSAHTNCDVVEAAAVIQPVFSGRPHARRFASEPRSRERVFQGRRRRSCAD